MKKSGLILVALLVAACGSSYPRDDSEKASLDRNCADAIRRFGEKDSSLKQWFGEKSYGYVVFPSVGKAGIGVGGAYGKGQVYEQGQHVGYSTLTQGTIGFQLGAQAYAEVVFFRDQTAFRDFTLGNFELSAQASAIAANEGRSADADYSGGVAIFTMGEGGLMFEATVGGQKFSYDAR